MNHLLLLSLISEKYKSILNDNLVGIYVHGSIAFGCFNQNKSDIDFIVVVYEKPTQSQKKELIRTLLDLNDEAPSKGFEMSVMLEKDCKNFRHPAPFELHFSNTHIDKCRNDLTEYCNYMNGTDRDLAAHLTVIKHTGIVLYGKEINDVFGDIPNEYYIDSIKYDIENAKEDISENPVYIILNLCRVLAYLRTGNVLSKYQGGLWGMQILPPEFNEIIKEAVNAYSSDIIPDINKVIADKFCDYMLDKINN